MSESDGFGLRQVKWKKWKGRGRERRGHEEVEVRKKMDEENSYERGWRVEKDKRREKDWTLINEQEVWRKKQTGRGLNEKNERVIQKDERGQRKWD